MKQAFLPIILLLQLGTIFAADYPTTTQKNSLLFQSWSINSQFGEEGILDAMLQRLRIKNGFFVEFGGWDAVHLSNTRFLADRGWKGAFIEADEKLVQAAKINCRHLPKVQCIQEFVTWPSARSQGKLFDEIADRYFPNEEIDVLSIDIDGADYLILESLKRRPKIIIIEGGICWFPAVTKRIPDSAAKQEINQPLAVIFDIAKKKGYKPVCFTINTFLVREDLYASFREITNDPVTLWFDSWHYFKKKAPHISEYVKGVRISNPWIRQFDSYPTPQ
jgi:hypothetical protein